MSLKHVGYIELPPHVGTGGFDHAATHLGAGQLYVAHTANDAVDVIDCATDRYVLSIPGLRGVAGVLAAEESNQVFTSNRAEDSVGIFGIRGEAKPIKVKVGHRPNGLAYDPARHLLLAANVGDPAVSGSMTAAIVDVERRSMVSCMPMPGRTRWAVFDHLSGAIPEQTVLSGAPDAIFFNAARNHLYVAIGDPSLIDVVDTDAMRIVETVRTEAGAHTIGFDPRRDRVYAFLPQTHRAGVYHDQGSVMSGAWIERSFIPLSTFLKETL